MSEKHGLCIGGPLSGQRKACQGDFMKAAIMRDVGPLVFDPAPNWQEMTYDTHVYKHFNMKFTDGGEMKTLNFWIDAEEDEPFNAVMSALVKCYEYNAKKVPLEDALGDWYKKP